MARLNFGLVVLILGQALSVPASSKSMRAWFASSERDPLQLHELDEAQYLANKRVQYRRQEARQ